MVSYGIFKIIHLLGIVMLVGNVTVTACWKFHADRTRDARIIAFSQRLVTITDYACTAWGLALTVIGGYAASWVAGLDPLRTSWIVGAEVMFALSGCIWLAVLLPIQVRQARQARAFTEGSVIPEGDLRDTRTWLLWGIVATMPVVAAFYVMVFKS